MAFPVLDALRDGYEVSPVVDAIGGPSEIVLAERLLQE